MSTSGGSGGGIPHVTAHLVAADFTILQTSPFVVVAAPPVGRAVNVVNAWYDFVPGDTVYNSAGSQNTGFLAYGLTASSGTGWDVADAIRELAPDGDNGQIRTTYTYQGVNAATSSGTFGAGEVDAQPVVATAFGNAASLNPLTVPGGATVNNAGTGYVPLEGFSVDVGAGTPATGHVVSVGALGIVTAIAIDTGGSGAYNTSMTDVGTTGDVEPFGLGTGLTVDIIGVQPDDGDLFITVHYVIETLH